MPVIFASRRAAQAALAAALLFPCLAGAEARSIEDRLAEARELLDHQDYRRVLRAAEPLAEDEAIPLRARLSAFELVGVASLLLRRQDDAQAAFEALLRLDPGYTLGDASYPPRIGEFLEMVRQSLGPGEEVPVTAVGEVPRSMVAGQELEVAVELGEGRARVDRVVLLFREGPDEDYRERPMECGADGGACVAEVEAAAGDFDLYVEARAPSGQRLGGIGTATEPLRVAVAEAAGPGGGREPGRVGEPGEGEPFHRTWWFWTIIGVGAAALVAGGVTAGVLLAEPPEPSPGTMGTVHLP